MGRFSRLGNDLYTGRRSIDFAGRRRLWYAVSAVIVLVAVGGLWFRGLDWGIEFTGGAEYRVSLPAEEVTQDTADQVRDAVGSAGVDNARSPVVTTSGDTAILVQTQPLTGAESEQVVEAIRASTGAGADRISQTELGASWGREIAERAVLGLGVFLVLVTALIWGYFRQWKMSVAALVALAHDVVITVGVYALSGFEVSPATVTGVLTILGFSLYDTVVVFDKVRENTADLSRSRRTYAEAANLAVNQTLVRSINTSIVALLPVAAILYVSVAQLGSGSLKDLALALFVGMTAGLYSSVFIATPLLVHLRSREPALREADRRARSRRRHDRDRHAYVPSYAGPGASREDTPTTGPPPTSPAVPAKPAAKGRSAPTGRKPVTPSRAAGRSQPSRRSRARRGKR